MEYLIEIYRPGSSDSGGIIRVFSAPVPFLPIRAGDLFNTKIWENDIEWPLLRVLNVEHLISENTTAGIDPAGRIPIGGLSISKTCRIRQKQGVNSLGWSTQFSLDTRLPRRTRVFGINDRAMPEEGLRPASGPSFFAPVVRLLHEVNRRRAVFGGASSSFTKR